MGIRLGIGIGIGKSAGSSWNPLKPLGGETPDFWIKENSRSGLVLTDSVNPANSPSILLPSFWTGGSSYAYVADNGALDINNGDFTFGIWIKGESASAPAAAWYIAGKGTSGGTEGSYIFGALNTGAYFCQIKSSGGYKYPTSTVLTTDQAWHFFLMDIDASANRFRFYIDNIQITTDITYVGTLNPMANVFEFLLGTASDATGAGFYNTSFANVSLADGFVFNRLFSDTERANALLKIYPTDFRAFWPCNSWAIHDVSANAYHMTTSSVTSDNLKYSAGGSRYCLDKGYSLYSDAPTLARLYVPYTIVGFPIASPLVNATYLKDKFSDDSDYDVPGNLVNHNYADSMLDFVGAEWDRSDATIFSNNARVTTNKDGGLYAAGTPKRWHICLLNKDWMNYFYNTGYQGRTFPKGTPNSAYDKTLLTEIISYATNKTGNDFKKVMKYTGDDEWYHTIDYYFEPIHIVAQRDNKVLAFDYATKILSLSLDGGATYPITQDIHVVSTIINDAFIFANGNIIFSNHQKTYLSTNNLSTYEETTVLDIASNPYTPSNYNNFRPLCTENFTYHGSQEYRIWGCYSIDAGTINTNINVWYTEDNGVTIKSVYKAGVTNPPLLDATHVHAINLNSNDDSVWLQTGDIVLKCNWIRGVYSAGTWTWEYIIGGTDNDAWKTTSMAFVGNEVYWSSDSSLNFKDFIFRASYANLLDITKYRRADYINGTKAVHFILKTGNNIIGAFITLNSVLVSSNSGKYFVRHDLAGGPTIMVTGGAGSYCNFLPPNSAGYIRGDIIEEGESLITDGWERGTVVMIKIIPL